MSQPTIVEPSAGVTAPQAGRSDSRGKAIARRIASEHLIWPILLLLFVIGFFVEGFMTSGNLLNLIWGAAPLGCMVLGLYFVMMAGKLDLSLESTFALAPAIAALAMTDWGLGIGGIGGIALTLIVGLAVGLFNGAVSVGLNVNPFLVTLATLLTLRGMVVYLMPEGIYDLPASYTALGGSKVAGVPIAVFVLLGLFAVAYVLMRYSVWGRNLVGIGNNEQACRVAGINVSATNIIAFVMAGLCAAIGGLLEAGRLFSVDASMGNGEILIVFAATTLGGTALAGGRGRVTGLLGAILVIGGITNLMNLIGVGASTQQIIFGAILLVAILLSSLQDRLRGARV
jgi:ribose/xylose/arabinose/galactoside ABC-type transport system permease subunit